MNICVSLNGVDLEPCRDFYWIPAGFQPQGKLVLRRPRPRPLPRSLADKVCLLFQGRWHDLGTPRIPYPDFVVVENWSAGIRGSFFLGTKEFDEHVCYHEDLQE